MNTYVISKPIRHTIEVERSKFICDLFYCESVEEAYDHLAVIRKEFPDASHHTYAFRIGNTSQHVKASDDGEPSRTAGMPMLDILEHTSLTNVMCIVTRYFGGTKLGTGGLIRAYSGALAQALKQINIYPLIPKQKFIITFDYAMINPIDYALKQIKCTVLAKDYDLKVSYECLFNSVDEFYHFLEQYHDVTFEEKGITFYKQEENYVTR